MNKVIISREAVEKREKKGGRKKGVRALTLENDTRDGHGKQVSFTIKERING